MFFVHAVVPRWRGPAREAGRHQGALTCLTSRRRNRRNVHADGAMGKLVARSRCFVTKDSQCALACGQKRLWTFVVSQGRAKLIGCLARAVPRGNQ